MSRKVYVEATVRFLVRADEDVDFDEFLETVECSLSNEGFNADIEDAQLSDFKILDSK